MRQLNEAQIQMNDSNSENVKIVALWPLCMRASNRHWFLYACEIHVFNVYNRIHDVNVKQYHHKHCHAFVYVNILQSILCSSCISLCRFEFSIILFRVECMVTIIYVVHSVFG